MRRAPAVIRRLARHRLALLTAMLAVTLAATLLAALTSFTAVVTGYAVRHMLAGSPGTAISVTGTVSGPAGARRAETRGPASLRALLPGVPMTVTSVLTSDYLVMPGGAGRNAETRLAAIGGLRRHAALVAGRWPGTATAPGPVPAAIGSAEARLLHLSAGSLIRLHTTVSGRPVPVRVTGIFRPLAPAGPYWALGGLLAPRQQNGGFTIYGPLAVSPATLLTGRVRPASVFWTARPDVGAIRTGDLIALARQLQTGLSALPGAPGLPGVQVSTGLPGLLSGLGTALVVARSQLAIGVLILLVVAGATLVLATALLASQRQGETAMLASRGAARWQLAASGLAEGVILVVPAAVAGPLLGGSMLPLLGERGPMAGSGLRLPAAYPPAAWLAAGLAAAVSALVIALPRFRAAPSPVARLAASGRRRALAAATHAGADLALVAAAAAAGWQLVHYAAPVSAGLDGAIGVDPVLVSAPVLALAAGAAVMLRLLPAAVRLADRAAARGRAITAAMAAWQISRRPLREAGPVLLMVLAVATTVVAVAQWSSWHRSAADRAAFGTGADLRLTLPPAAPLAPGRVAALTGAPGVTGATPVLRLPVDLAGRARGTLLALDPGPATRVALIRPDLAGGSPARVLRRLRQPGAGYGLPLPGRPARLQLSARLTASPVLQPVLGIQVTDRFGIAYQLTAGTVPADGRSHLLTTALAPGGQAAYPLRITGFSLQYQMPPRVSAPVTLTVGPVRVSDAAAGGFGPAIPAGPLARQPVTHASAGGTLANAAGPVLATPGRVSVLAAAAGIRVTFSSGAGDEALANPPGPPGRVPGTISVTGPPPAGALPALATRAFLAAIGQQAGGVFPVSVAGVSLSVRVVGDVTAFPTINGSGLVVNQAALQQAMAAAGALPQPVTEWWLGAAGRAGARDAERRAARVPGSAVTSRAAVQAALLADPLAAAPQLAMLAIAAGAAILAAAGLAVGVASARERARDVALLRALGATTRQVRRVLCLEQALLAGPGAAAGLALGVLLARFIVPAVTLTPAGAHPQPPVLVQVPLAVPAALAALVAVVPVMLAGASAGREPALAGRLREEAQT